MLFLNTTEPSQNSIEQPETFQINRFKPQRVRFAQDEDLSDVLTEMQDNEMIMFWTKGRWSMHQLIKHVLKIVGPADVTLCTWAVTEEPLRAIHNLKQSGQIKKLVGLFEHKIKTRGAVYAFAEQFFDEVHLTKCHAKVTIIEGETLSVSIMCSANLTVNRRIEAGVIYCNREAATNNKNYIQKDGFSTK